MAIGVDNPKKPGETVWLFKVEDIRDLIPDDIYKAFEEFYSDAEQGGYDASEEEWEKWQSGYFEEEKAYLDDVWDELERMWEKINDRSKKLDRGDLISGFKLIRDLIKSRLNNF
jgi:hypothetical protein